MNDEELLTTLLTRRADRLMGAPLSLDQVRGRARQIRRRRRGTAIVAGAAAAALAIVVPTTLLADGTQRSTDPDQIATAPTSAAAPLNRGAAVLQDGEVTLSDGGSVPVAVKNQDVVAFGVLSDDRIVLGLSTPFVVRVYLPDGTLDQEYDVASNDITMSPTDDLVAWVDEDLRVQVLESGVPDPVTLQGIPVPGEGSGSIDAVLGSDCADGGCRVLGGDFSTTTVESTRDATTELTTSEPLRVSDVSPDERTWAVEFPRQNGEQYGCVGLYDVDAAQVTARNCDTSNLTFSPDGKLLLGARYENNMAGEVRILDLDLETLATYQPAPRVIGRAAWADATHVVAGVAGLQDNQWSLVRVGLDGAAETVAGPVAGVKPEIGQEYLPSQ